MTRGVTRTELGIMLCITAFLLLKVLPLAVATYEGVAFFKAERYRVDGR